MAGRIRDYGNLQGAKNTAEIYIKYPLNSNLRGLKIIIEEIFKFLIKFGLIISDCLKEHLIELLHAVPNHRICLCINISFVSDCSCQSTAFLVNVSISIASTCSSESLLICSNNRLHNSLVSGSVKSTFLYFSVSSMIALKFSCAILRV